METVEYTWKNNDFTEVEIVSNEDNLVLVTSIKLQNVGIGEDWYDDLKAGGGTNLGFWRSHGCYLQLLTEDGKHIEPWGFSSLTIRADTMNTPYNANTNPTRDHELEFSFPYPFIVPKNGKLTASVAQNNIGGGLVPEGDVVSLQCSYVVLPGENPVGIPPDEAIVKTFNVFNIASPFSPEKGEYIRHNLLNAENDITIEGVYLSFPLPTGAVNYTNQVSYQPRIRLCVNDGANNYKYPTDPVNPHNRGSGKVTPAYYRLLLTPFKVVSGESLEIDIPAFYFTTFGARNEEIKDYLRVVVHYSYR